MNFDLPGLQVALWIGLGVFVGAFGALLVLGRLAERKLLAVEDDWQTRLNAEKQNVKRVKGENDSLQAELRTERELLEKFKHGTVARSTELQSAHETVNHQTQALSAMTAERDALHQKLQEIHRSFVAARHRVSELEDEFVKSREFYKGQLMSAFSQRQELERTLESAKTEHEALHTLFNDAKLEQENAVRKLESAETKLGGLDDLEEKLIALEADNAQLRHEVDAASARLASADQESDQVETLRVQNAELIESLEAMEASRKRYEADAVRYRQQYDSSENESETLRLKLGDIRERLQQMEEEHAAARTAMNGSDSQPAAPDHGDDLTEIVGIGKVFASMLHGLGIRSFRQLAASSAAELAQLSADFRDVRSRIENDDWVGQAKQLHDRKYGTAIAHASS